VHFAVPFSRAACGGCGPDLATAYENTASVRERGEPMCSPSVTWATGEMCTLVKRFVGLRFTVSYAEKTRSSHRSEPQRRRLGQCSCRPDRQKHLRKDTATERGREVAKELHAEHSIHNLDGTTGRKKATSGRARSTINSLTKPGMRNLFRCCHTTAGVFYIAEHQGRFHRAGSAAYCSGFEVNF